MFQAGVRGIAARAVTGQHLQHGIHSMQNNAVLRQVTIGRGTPKRLRSTMAPLVQQLTNQLLWSHQQQGNSTTMRALMSTTSPKVTVHISENAADTTSSTIPTTTTSQSITQLNLECGILEEDDDGYVCLLDDAFLSSH